MGKLIIHIGPPKTASTSFQRFFQDFKSDNFKYIGVFQPRNSDVNKKENWFRNQVYSYIKGNFKNCDYKQIKKNTNELLNKYEFVLFSEEMILHESDWKSKISKLFELFNNFEPQIIFCVRNPNHAIPSYYQEIFNYLPKSLRDSYEDFKNSNFVEIYNYSLIYKTLRKSGFKKITWFKFEHLVNSNVTLGKITIDCDKIAKNNIEVDGHNLSSKEKNVRLIRYDSFPKQNRLIIKGVNLFRKIGLEKIYHFLRHSFIMKIQFSYKKCNKLQEQFEIDLDFLGKVS